jgi:protein TonB
MQALQPITAKTQAAIHPAISHTAAATAQSSPPKPAAAASPSSYAPGVNVLPHPPYPTEARDRGQTGTVVMNVHFDARGDVALAEVAQSSGVPILDSETRSFIRAHWHSPAYAGRAVSVPVQYKLENL